MVDREEALGRMEGYLLSPVRQQLVVGLVPRLPVDTPAGVREILGLEGQLYVVVEESPLDRQCLPASLALHLLSVRIWWPRLTGESDHPLVRPFPGTRRWHTPARPESDTSD
jgi:hypothetical protein